MTDVTEEMTVEALSLPVEEVMVLAYAGFTELDTEQFWKGDIPHDPIGEPALWTKDRAPDGLFKGQYQGGQLDTATGEVTGGTWVDTKPIAPAVLARMEQEALLQLIAQARYDQEVLGVFWYHFFIATDRESQSKLDQANGAARQGVRRENAVWKCYDMPAESLVFRPTTNAEMTEIATRAYQYVADCFDREGELVRAVQGGTYTPDMLTQGWPSRDITPKEATSANS